MTDFYSSGYGDQGQHQQQQQQRQHDSSGFYDSGRDSSAAGGGYSSHDGSINNSNGSNNISMSQQQHQQQQQQQHQQSQQQPSFWNPAVSAAMVGAAASMGDPNNPYAMMDIGMKAGQTFFDEGIARMIPGLERSMTALRVYFAVNNGYVKRKMQRVLCAFFYKDWCRISDEDPVGTGQSMTYRLPHSDDNAFDLYIPSMSLITYVLLCALLYGSTGQFNPEIIPDVTSKCFITQIIEVALMRTGFVMIESPCRIFDLFAVTGYKYLGLCVNMLVGLLSSYMGYGQRGYYVTFLWTASSAAYFMLKTMANNVPKKDSSETGAKREFAVVAFAISQFASMWFLGQTKVLN